MPDADTGHAFRPQLRPPYKQTAAPGLAFETWDPPSRVYGMNGNGSDLVAFSSKGKST
jgi:hypothetical protein